VGGSGEVLLPLSLEIVRTDISSDDNEGAVGVRELGGKEKSGSCRQPGDENASCSEDRVLQPLGVDGAIYAGGSTVRANWAFPSVAQLAIGCSNPISNSPKPNKYIEIIANMRY